MLSSTLMDCFYYIWHTGYWAGVGLYLFKYGDYAIHKHWYLSDERTRELYEHDHKWHMVVRNFLFYCCLSWYGVYMFITRDD